MTRPPARRALIAAASMLCTLALAACGGGGDPLAGQGPADTLTIGSADFTESQVLAALYAEALTAKGVKVRQTPPIGSRETYIPALRDGSIDLIPEYSGTLLQYFDKSAPQTAPDDVDAALRKAVPAPLTVLDRSAAEDKDAVVVTRATAEKYRASSIADLAPHCGEIVFGGPPEFQTRPDGIPGIQKTYHCSFASYTSLDAGGPLTQKQLVAGAVQAADLFTTDPGIVTNDLVVLADPKNNFAAQNVLPLINSTKATDRVKQVLNGVSAKLTTQVLIDLRRQVDAPDKPSPAVVARAWLSRNGLG